MEINKEVLKGHIDTLIVSVLKNEDCYGYEIAKRIRERSELDMKEGTLYLALKRLESKNIVKSYWSDEHTSGGKRKYYHITDEGHEFLKIKKEEWQFIKKVMDQFLEEA